jgi:endoribonuclease Dicer
MSLFPTIITVKHSSQPPHAPILLLTRQPLPAFPSFKLFYSGTPVTVQTYRGATLSIDDAKLLSLHMYTLRLCRAVANKPFSCPFEDTPYFLAPLSSSWTAPHNIGRWQLSDVADHIPWALVTRGALSWSMPLKYGRAEDVTEDIEDAVIQDRSTELTRRYDVLRVRSDLSPLSRPEDSPVGCRNKELIVVSDTVYKREAKYGSLLEYCKFVRKNFEGLKDEGQAIIEVSSVMRGVSRLDPASHPPGLDGPPPPRCTKV